MFDLVADIERYPDFVPGYVRARVIDRRDETLLVDQIVGLMGVHYGFRSVATLGRPERLRVRSSDRPFRHLEIDWRFTPRSSDRAHVELVLRYELRRGMVRRLGGLWLQPMARRILQAFLDRARAVYGPVD